MSESAELFHFYTGEMFDEFIYLFTILTYMHDRHIKSYNGLKQLHCIAIKLRNIEYVLVCTITCLYLANVWLQFVLNLRCVKCELQSYILILFG